MQSCTASRPRHTADEPVDVGRGNRERDKAFTEFHVGTYRIGPVGEFHLSKIQKRRGTSRFCCTVIARHGECRLSSLEK